LRTVYLDFTGRAQLFWGPVTYRDGLGTHIDFKEGWLDGPADAVAIPVQRMPSPAKLVSWGLQSGLKGNAFELVFGAAKDGILAGVGEWADVDDVHSVVEMHLFDPDTGKRIVREPEPEAGPMLGPEAESEDS
jgi:hypothetical protein